MIKVKMSDVELERVRREKTRVLIYNGIHSWRF